MLYKTLIFHDEIKYSQSILAIEAWQLRNLDVGRVVFANPPGNS